MGQPESKPRLIHTKRGAVIALCFTGYVAALSVWNVLWHSQRQHHWLLDFDWLVLWHISLPGWIVAGVNLAFYAGLLWGGLLFYRAAAIGPMKALMAAAAFLAAVDIFLKMPASGHTRVDDQTSRNT
jgi:hypothetical protein